MRRFYDFLGRLLFPRRQDWEQRRHARTFVFTVAFTLVFSLVMVEFIHLIYNHEK
jgi:hypothetical protein